MSLSFPRSDIFSNWRFITQDFALKNRQELSRRGSGRVQAVDFGPAVWMASFTTPKLSHDDCLEVQADLQSLDGVMSYFEVYDTRRPYPKFYPKGDFDGTFLIDAIGDDNKSFSISGLPAGFVLKKADRISITYGEDNILALVEVSEDAVQAGSAGLTATFEVRPHLLGDIAAGDVITLHRPPVHMQLVPESISFNDAGRLLGTVSFQTNQYL